MFKAINGRTPPYLTDSTVMTSEAHDRITRLTNSFDVQLLPNNSEICMRSAFFETMAVSRRIVFTMK